MCCMNIITVVYHFVCGRVQSDIVGRKHYRTTDILTLTLRNVVGRLKKPGQRFARFLQVLALEMSHT